MITFTQNNFNLQQIADSGQCFRMCPIDPAAMAARFPNEDFDFGYFIVSGSSYLEIYQKGTSITACCGSESEDNNDDDLWSFWHRYFDMDTDYAAMIAAICPEDTYLMQAADFGSGIRILNQDPWEMIITFIISQQKTIPKIREAVEQLSRRYGTACTNFRGEAFYAFPTPQQLSKASLEDLLALKLGYRAKYIYKTCQDAVSGRLDLTHLQSLNYTEAMSYLMQFYGIGEKVANCICLFGLHHIDAFPVDTWIQKILLREYFKPEYEKLPKNRLFSTIIQDHFGMYEGFGGVMQQYIFFYERTQ